MAGRQRPITDEFEEEVPQNVNPLAQYFRMPGLHVKLPSQGRFMPAGSIDLTATGEVPVLPMRAYDEILMKSPDALLSGYAIEKLVESCVPAVRNVKLLSAPDLDVLLLAIRAATFGTTMPIESVCPKCEEVNQFDMNIANMLENIKELDPENVIELSPMLKVFLRPYNVENATQASLAAYTEAKKIRGLENAPEDERSAAINESINKLNKVNLILTSDCVLRIVTGPTEVSNRQHIAEFMQQVPSPWYNQIEKHLKGINSQGLDRKQAVKCAKCEHEWQTEVEFDPASFFETGS